MKSRISLLGFVSALLLFSVPVWAAPKTYALKSGEVSFVSRITGGTFVTQSNSLSGRAEYNATTGELKSAKVSVKADSLDSGISLRNSHMRNKYLEVSKYPEISFEAQNIKWDPGSKQIKISGQFSAKGKIVPLSANADLQHNNDGSISLNTQFQLNILDFGIPQPGFAVVKMQPLIDVKVSMQFQAAGTP